jgi:hypothetical protein
MPMNNRILRPLARPLLLDAVPGAAAAYSLRQLSNAYTGPVVTVRRSSDDAEADFKASEIDDGTLTAFCGAGNGFVKTWFDQSGSGNDASQGTAFYQPNIVDSGTLVTEGGKAALRFDGTNDRLDLTGLSAGPTKSQCASFAVASPLQFSGTSANFRFFDVIAGATSFQLAADNASGKIAMKNSYWQASITSTTFQLAQLGQQLYSAAFGTSENNLHIDGAAKSVTAAINVGAVGTLGKIGARADSVSTTFFGGTYQELVLYFSDQTANRERIEGDLAWYY